MPITTSDGPSASTKKFTANLAQAAATYDLATATGGDILIEAVAIYVATAGATFTSTKIHTNQTNDTNLMTVVEGAVANLVAQKVVPIAGANSPVFLASGQKIQYTIAGATGTGSLTVALRYRSLDSGASLV